MTTQELQQLLAGVKNLPILPRVAVRLLELLNSPSSSMNDLNEIMSKDPALTATILKIVNSAYYGLRNRVSSLSHALTLLGYRAVKNIVLTAAASGLFRLRKRTACFDPDTFTVHSVASAAVCRYLAHYSGVADPEMAYSLGLLHDIGKLAMDQCFAKQYFEAVMWARRNRKSAHEAERNLCGFDHAAVGEALTTVWQLPKELCEAIGLHHDPEAIVGLDIIALAHMADYTCSVKELSAHDTFVSPELNHRAWKRLQLDARVLPHLFASLDEEIDKARQMLSATSA